MNEARGTRDEGREAMDDGRWFDKLTMIGKKPFALSPSTHRSP